MSNKKDNRGELKDAFDSYNDNLSENLRDSAMMAHLEDALKKGTDIGPYGRLTFAMVARHFMNEDELVSLLAKEPGVSEEDARALVLQVTKKDYNPPKRERILEWQAQQDYQICPNPEDPNGCNVYKELKFPEGIYNRIDDFWIGKAEEIEEK